MQTPSAHTKLIVLLGNPLGHSYSALMHNTVFAQLNMDCLYLPVEVTAENLSAVFSGLTRMNVGGFNVTIPHKQRIMELLDEIDPLAKAIGAVNTICLQEGRTRGYNTDGEGFLKSLEEELSISIDRQNVFVIGCGGAARAIVMTLASRGAERIFLCNRTASKAEALATEINRKFSAKAEVVTQEPRAMATALRSCHILVNTTSLGMHPNVDEIPLDEGLLFKNLAVADIVYNPLITRLLQVSRTKGCRIVDGLGMLVYQGAAAFRLWTGIEPATDAMFAAVRRNMHQDY